MIETMELAEPYRPRRVLPLEDFGIDGWRLKVYGIVYGAARPRAELTAAALAAAAEYLPRPAVTDQRYGVGFLGVHDGRGGNFVFLDWWEEENELHHVVFYSTSARPAQLRMGAPGEAIACVWDLSVIAHERRAWIRHVLGREEGPSLDAYLGDRLDDTL